MAAALLLAPRAQLPTAPRAAGASVSSLLALLNESDRTLQEHAIRRISMLVDSAWAEIAEHVARIEALGEDGSFPAHGLACLSAARVYYHLGDTREALRLALSAGEEFDVTDASPFTQSVLAGIIDAYAAAATTSTLPALSRNVVAAVDRMFAACLRSGALKQALGVAYECRREDVIAAVCARHVEVEEDLLQHALALAVNVVSDAPFRRAVIKLISEAYKADVTRLLPTSTDVEALSACVLPLSRCMQTLDDAHQLAALLTSLLHAAAAASGASAGTPVSLLLAYQVAFDAVESENQAFLVALAKALPADVAPEQDAVIVPATTAEGSTPVTTSTALAHLRRILTGTAVPDLLVDFLSSACSADPLLLKQIKTSTDAPRNSVLHHAVAVAHAYMYAGTGVDTFLRTNLEWLGRATNWAKFSASASQGVVHKGRTRDAMAILAAYLPAEGAASASPYSEGGALYALGLIHANRGAAASLATPPAASAAAAAPAGDVIAYLSAALRNTRDEVMQHGACLGLGAAAMSTGEDALYTQMRDAMFQENAVVGEGAALGIGLLLTGRGASWVSEASGEAAATEMMSHAHDTAHEKTIRGIAVALALMCYGGEDSADVLIGQLVRDKDAVLRYGGMYALGLAYVGTGSNAAVRQLLHVAVSDVSDDVRRAAVTNIGFVLARSPREVAVFVAQLAESYNPHVRYGAAMAVGIACAGSGLPEAVGLLEPLLDDPVDFVRQGTLLALGLVLAQETEKHLPKTKAIRDRFAAMIKDRHQSTMTKMGAILASGLIDVAGRNGVVSMISRGGFVKMSSVVGVALWLQYWYWFPLLHFLSLAITATPCIGVCDDLASITTDFHVEVACPPSWFAYPEHLVEEKKDKLAGVTTAELSVTAKARAKAAAKAKDKGTAGAAGGVAESKMDLDDAPAAASAAAPAAGAAPAGAATASSDVVMEDGDKKKEEKEATSYTVSNPARITYAQAKFVRVPAGQRYKPVRQDLVRGTGITVLIDTRAGSGELDASRRALKVPAIGADADDTPEARAPEAFEWTVGEYA